MFRKCTIVLFILRGWVTAPEWKWPIVCFHLASFICKPKTRKQTHTQKKKKILFWEYVGTLLENAETLFIILPLARPNALITMRPTSYRGLRKSHKNILQWLKIAFPPPKNRTMHRENTSTPFWGNRGVWGQPQGGGRDPPAPAPPRSPLLLSQARILCQEHDAVLYQNPFLACTESDQPWVRSQNDFFGGGNSMFGRERMKHLKRSACQQKKKAVIGIKGRKTFPGSLCFVQHFQKELIHISTFTNWPSSCNRRKHWDPAQKHSLSLCEGWRCLCRPRPLLPPPLRRGKEQPNVAKTRA